MKNLKIKFKLMLGFSFVAFMAVVVGIVGTIGLKNTENQFHRVFQENVPVISSLAHIRETFALERLMLRTMLIDMNDPAKLQNDIDKIKAYKSEIDASMAECEAALQGSSAIKSFLTAKDTYQNDYASVRDKIINATKFGDYETALAAIDEGLNVSSPLLQGLDDSVAAFNETVAAESAALSANATATIVIQYLAMGVAVLSSILLGIYLSSMISKPITLLSDFLVRFGENGDLSMTEQDRKNVADNADNHDEIGFCINAAVKMVNRLVEVNNTLGSVADGDLTVHIAALSEKDSIGLSVRRVLSSLNAMFGELRSASMQVSAGAEQISLGSQQLAAGSSEQAASVEEFSATLSDMQEKTRLTAENSANAATVNEDIGMKLEESLCSMSQMLEAMKGIDESSRNITRIIKVIDDIAFQTNILALNAAVEAARAGQHGKGFAVVADEVRNLAGKSAAAAKETAALIEGSSEKVKEGNNIVDKTNTSLVSVAAGSKEVVRLISEVSVATSEQARAITEINQGIEQIASVVQENSASAEESAASAEEMSAQATALNKIIEKFRVR